MERVGNANRPMAAIPSPPAPRSRLPLYLIVGATAVAVSVLLALLLSGPVHAGDKEVRVIYGGWWNGAVGDEEALMNLHERGQHSYLLDGFDIIAHVAKADGSTDELWVAIIYDDHVVEMGNTTEPYGTVFLDHSF